MSQMMTKLIMSGTILSSEYIISKLKDEARDSWTGKIGEERAVELETFIRQLLKHYSSVLGFTEKEILIKIEERRNYSAINYYQECHFPNLDKVAVFDTVKQFQDTFPSGKFICPRCKGITTDSQTCNSGVDIGKGKRCDWKAWGLFRTMGEGYRFVIKETFLTSPVVYEMFKPVELK